MELPFQIVERESFKVLGYRIQTTNQKHEGRTMIPKYWQKFHSSEQRKVLLSHSIQEPYGIFGISEYNINLEDSRDFAYYIAIASGDEPQDELVSYTVPKMTWAVFPCTLETMGKVQALAITKWLPKSKYRPINKGYITGKMKSGAPDIECYLNEKEDVQIWVGVTEK